MKVLLLSRQIDIIKDILPLHSKIGFIATAGEVYSNPIWIEEDRNLLLKYGYKIYNIDITNNSTNESIELINNVDCLYIAGGNTFYLKQQIEEKSLKYEIKEFINKNKLYVGASAGSCLCSPTLELYRTLDNPEKAGKLTDFGGLNIIDYVIIPHYGKEKYLEIHQDIIKKYNAKYGLIKLKDNEAVFFENRNKYKLYKIDKRIV